MRYLPLLLLFFSIKSFSQTTVGADGFTKSWAFGETNKQGNLLVKGGGYADYPVSISVSGIYTFTFQILNEVGRDTYITIKTPYGKTALAKATIPLGKVWQTVSVNVKLLKTTKAVRLAFEDDVTFNSFSYVAPAITMPAPTPIYSANNTQDVNLLKIQVKKLEYSLDSLRNAVKTNVYQFYPNDFDWQDSAHRVLKIRRSGL